MIAWSAPFQYDSSKESQKDLTRTMSLPLILSVCLFMASSQPLAATCSDHDPKSKSLKKRDQKEARKKKIAYSKERESPNTLHAEDLKCLLIQTYKKILNDVNQLCIELKTENVSKTVKDILNQFIKSMKLWHKEFQSNINKKPSISSIKDIVDVYPSKWGRKPPLNKGAEPLFLALIEEYLGNTPIERVEHQEYHSTKSELTSQINICRKSYDLEFAEDKTPNVTVADIDRLFKKFKKLSDLNRAPLKNQTELLQYIKRCLTICNGIIDLWIDGEENESNSLSVSPNKTLQNFKNKIKKILSKKNKKAN